MSDRTVIVLFIGIAAFSIILYIFLRSRKEEKKEIEKDKEFVVRFLYSLLPKSATLMEISDYTGFDVCKVKDIMLALVKDRRVLADVDGIFFTHIAFSDNTYKYRHLRLVK